MWEGTRVATFGARGLHTPATQEAPFRWGGGVYLTSQDRQSQPTRAPPLPLKASGPWTCGEGLAGQISGNQGRPVCGLAGTMTAPFCSTRVRGPRWCGAYLQVQWVKGLPPAFGASEGRLWGFFSLLRLGLAVQTEHAIPGGVHCERGRCGREKSRRGGGGEGGREGEEGRGGGKGGREGWREGGRGRRGEGGEGGEGGGGRGLGLDLDLYVEADLRAHRPPEGMNGGLPDASAYRPAMPYEMKLPGPSPAPPLLWRPQAYWQHMNTLCSASGALLLPGPGLNPTARSPHSLGKGGG